jgi:hypothetical protein
MRFAGYIGTVLALAVTYLLQLNMPDEFTRFLTWTVPSTIAFISWLIQLLLRSKKLQKSLIESITKSVMSEINKRFAELKAEIRSEVVDEVWLRIDTITNLTKPKEHEAEPADAKKS